ncbi:hypothetical protein C3L29_031625 [Pseudomonas sp. MWU12-2534b]|nr:hypothetical protein C3L29_031625 [Pseudomonas sp. MWU12-2534b]
MPDRLRPEFSIQLIDSRHFSNRFVEAWQQIDDDRGPLIWKGTQRHNQMIQHHETDTKLEHKKATCVDATLPAIRISLIYVAKFNDFA